MEGRFVLDGAIFLHENLHDIHKTNTFDFMFNDDFGKAYDDIN